MSHVSMRRAAPPQRSAASDRDPPATPTPAKVLPSDPEPAVKTIPSTHSEEI
jgi:hypothetical protein